MRRSDTKVNEKPGFMGSVDHDYHRRRVGDFDAFIHQDIPGQQDDSLSLRGGCAQAHEQWTQLR